MSKLIVFDLDGTLAKSKAPLERDMADAIVRLLQKKSVAVVSGCRFSQFATQFLANLPQHADISRLFLFPTCGAAFYRFENNAWKNVYSEDLSESEKKRIITALEDALDRFGHNPSQLWGEMIEDRGSQITFSALGQAAPLEEKAVWDPDQQKRAVIREMLLESIDDFDINYGGTTSIDITRKGIDKAYGLNKMVEVLGFSIPEMIFVGDRLEPGGNDYAARRTGVRCIAVTGPEHTLDVINAILQGKEGNLVLANDGAKSLA
ncbi:HAD-IIB family hydrolase [Desulfovibrio inopinatus]|uniref:HAD-IIB family hydrolase n=1 Tax=Desulfovibrio inopinatus TaxID=102109 RepID=UPI000686D188|nr:HAD-IIB family hydrolase [Desulfovibrio inopinatus]